MITALQIARSKTEEILISDEVHESEEVIEKKFLLRVTMLDQQGHHEPLKPPIAEMHISVYRMKDSTCLVRLYTLK
jgi:hypothetical protein